MTIEFSQSALKTWYQTRSRCIGLPIRSKAIEKDDGLRNNEKEVIKRTVNDALCNYAE